MGAPAQEYFVLGIGLETLWLHGSLESAHQPVTQSLKLSGRIFIPLKTEMWVV